MERAYLSRSLPLKPDFICEAFNRCWFNRLLPYYGFRTPEDSLRGAPTRGGGTGCMIWPPPPPPQSLSPQSCSDSVQWQRKGWTAPWVRPVRSAPLTLSSPLPSPHSPFVALRASLCSLSCAVLFFPSRASIAVNQSFIRLVCSAWPSTALCRLAAYAGLWEAGTKAGLAEANDTDQCELTRE